MMTSNTDEWLTVQEAAKISGYHAEYLRLLVREGKLSAKKFGPLWAISKFSLLAYLEIARKSDDGRQGPKIVKH
jgi:excisionase family DNA binding protein